MRLQSDCQMTSVKLQGLSFPKPGKTQSISFAYIRLNQQAKKKKIIIILSKKLHQHVKNNAQLKKSIGSQAEGYNSAKMLHLILCYL